MRSKEIETQEEMLMNCRFEATGLKKVFKKKKKQYMSPYRRAALSVNLPLSEKKEARV